MWIELPRIVSITTDGASVMRKVGQLSRYSQHLYLAHGIQLGVVDTLYKKIITFKSNNDENSHDNDVEDGVVTDIDDADEEDFSRRFEITLTEQNEKNIEVTDDLQPLIAKVRTVVRLFRRSPTKNDKTLQKYTSDEFEKSKPFILVTKTRWRSLHNML